MVLVERELKEKVSGEDLAGLHKELDPWAVAVVQAIAGRGNLPVAEFYLAATSGQHSAGETLRACLTERNLQLQPGTRSFNLRKVTGSTRLRGGEQVAGYHFVRVEVIEQPETPG